MSLNFWQGEGGDAYTRRNRVDWRKRIQFWKRIKDLTGMRSAYEVGCNAGWNLSAIRARYWHDWDVEVAGYEPNDLARAQACFAGLNVDELMYDFTPQEAEFVEAYELVFTCGVLIHVPPRDLEAMMRKIIRASSHYVLAIEYASNTEQMIEYRGQPNLLWKRPYGKLYEDLGCKHVAMGEATKDDGFDDCTWWLLEKK